MSTLTATPQARSKFHRAAGVCGVALVILVTVGVAVTFLALVHTNQGKHALRQPSPQTTTVINYFSIPTRPTGPWHPNQARPARQHCHHRPIGALQLRSPVARGMSGPKPWGLTVPSI
jgi:hypothetical protein